MSNDPRYRHTTCAHCGRDWQFIDWGCASHRLTCVVDSGSAHAYMLLDWRRVLEPGV